MSSILDWQIDPDKNDRSDQNINWREGQPPSSVNNSARGMMARTAEFIQDSFGLTKAEGGPTVYSARLLMDIKKLDSRLAFDCIFAKRPEKNATLNLNSLGELPLLCRTETLSDDEDQLGFAPFMGRDILVGVPYRVRFIAPEYLNGYPKGAFFIADAETKPIFLKEAGFTDHAYLLAYQKFYYKKDGLVRQWGKQTFRNAGFNSDNWYSPSITYIRPFKEVCYPTLTLMSNTYPKYVPFVNVGKVKRDSFTACFPWVNVDYGAAIWQACAYEPD